ncbi:SDR family oxidoreductase [Flagellatimonas centrodinii]|uniref:SDR family oxidoreductase n=1 Tax=Flagellatimonas centrodinii TaxID=2806210 RepID=UPI001FF0468A|nr:SDR family oxidoreductase [Flagellatimonas centrodinii]ULQ48205.1 SDR family oxidoreductase [Flagellatimonas centrodinii]
MSRLSQQRVAITGAGSGLGRAIALAFAGRGWRVAVTDRDLAGASDTLKQVESAGGSGFVQAVDVTREEDFAALADSLTSRWGGVDVLINNAGVATAGTTVDASLEQWRWIIDINLLGCVRGVRALAPLMTAQRDGHIVNIASFAGVANPPAMASYNATKAAVISLSETLRFEMSAFEVGVSVACPSFFKTRLMETSQAQAREASPAEASDAPAPQMGKIVTRLMDKASVTAEDVADDILGAVLDNRFLVITHPDARRQYHLKRLAPEWFFRAARRSTAAFLTRR